MSNGLNKPGTRAQVRSISQRVETLEQNMARFLFAVNQQGQQQGQEIANLKEMVEGLVELNGAEEVQRIVNEKRVERARAQSAQEKASLDEGITDGYVIAAEKIEEKSLIVGRYVGKDGTVTEPGRAQLVVPGIAPQYREKLIGQSAGFKLTDLPDGGHFEVLEVYSVDEAKANEVIQAKQKAQAEAAAKAAEEAAKADEAADTGTPMDGVALAASGTVEQAPESEAPGTDAEAATPPEFR
jgi:hypothetical protein